MIEGFIEINWLNGLKRDLIQSGINRDIDLPAVVIDPREREGFTCACETDFADVDPGITPDLNEGFAGCCAGGSGDTEGNLGNRGVDCAESVVSSAVDVAKVGSEVFRRKETGVVTGPPRQVSGVEGGIDDILEMSVVGSFVGGAGREKLGQIPIGSQAAACPAVEAEVHVPREIHHPSVRRSDVKERVVLRSAAVIVSDPAENLTREGAQPLINI